MIAFLVSEVALLNCTDIGRDGRVAAVAAGKVSAEYGAVLRMLIDTSASGPGSQPGSDVAKAAAAAPASRADFARRAAVAWAQDDAR